ncbi:putative defensin-like protein 257 [Raphanus sativus]|nr:putative defensin-like protein 257 [Raphanus sativus]
MKNVSLKASLLIFILVITSNFGVEARELTEAEVMAGSSSDATKGNTLDSARPPCKRDIDCSFACPKGGFCNNRLGSCDCF